MNNFLINIQWYLLYWYYSNFPSNLILINEYKIKNISKALF